MWTEDRWTTFCALMEHGFPGEFPPTARRAWRMLLDAYEPAQCIAALRSLIAAGGTFRPSVSELVGAIAQDPTAPTFTEAIQLLYAHPAGVLHARSAVALGQRLDAAHPLIAAFARSAGIERLRHTNLDDPDWGQRNRRELQREWDSFCERAHERQAAALTQGREPRAGLTAFSPLAALGAGTKQLTEGEQP